MADPASLDAFVRDHYLIPCGTLIICWLARELAGILRKKKVDMRTELNTNTAAVAKLNTDMVLNTAQLRNLNEQLGSVLRIKIDVQEAHTKIRVIEQRLKSKNL